jgi:hypothetical protein
MRHSDPSLSASVCTDPRLLGAAGAVYALPELPFDDSPGAGHAKAAGACAQSFVARAAAHMRATLVNIRVVLTRWVASQPRERLREVLP